MKDINFDFLWDILIVKLIEQLYKEFDKDKIEEFDIRIKDKEIVKKNIYREYNKIRKSLKQKYYYKGNSPNAKIDNHKIASCFCKSLINNKIFVFKIKKEISNELFLINYRLAYQVSIGIIYITLIDYYNCLGKTEIVNKLIKQKTLLVPNTTEGHDDYNWGRIKTLALNDMYGNEFDLLTYSDMMFWIEHYNKLIMDGNLIIEN